MKKSDMIDARQQFSTAANKIANSNDLHQIEQTLQKLALVLEDFDKREGFEPDEDVQVYRYKTNKVDEETQQANKETVDAARMIVARAGLRMLQQVIPTLSDLGKQCLETAGKDAVRTVCAPTMREGTDYNGEPFKPIPSEFTLPRGYESVLSRVKSALTN